MRTWPKDEIESAEILAVGTEILLGQIENSNATYLARELRDLGINCWHQTVVGDNKARIANALREAIDRSDFVLVTGGLGPTPDDITMAVAAEVAEKPLIFHQEILDQIQSFFSKSGREMPVSNRKQAMIPEGAIILPNANGTAPGAIIPIVSNNEDKAFILLPGPPIENKGMFEIWVKPLLQKASKYALHNTIIRMIDIGESALAEKIPDLLDDAQDNPSVAPYASTGEVKLRVSYKHKKGETIEPAHKIIAIIKERFDEYIYEIGERELDKVVTDELMLMHKSISVIESCTTGNIMRKLGQHPGISTIYKGGLVAYQNGIKEMVLGLEHAIISKYGVVSEKAAEAMAKQGLALFQSDICVASTGNAGPGGEEGKPVGLVYLAVATKKKCLVKEFHFQGNREKVIHLATLQSFNMIRKMLEEIRNSYE